MLKFMKLIVGLGNVGREYAETRHNVGFMVADFLAGQHGLEFSKQASIFKDMELAKADDYIVLKPHTMMNLSGRAIQAVAQFYKIDPSDTWVIHDDFDLEFGKLRLRHGGSSGGHNGLRSAIEALGQAFGRIRIGVRNQQFNNPFPAVDFVLQKFTNEEIQQLPKIIEKTSAIILGQLGDGQLTDTSFDLLYEPEKINKSVSAGGVVTNPVGEVLVVNQNGDSWSLPKGHLDGDETPERAAKREIYEESGIQDLTLVKKLGIYERPRLAFGGGDDPTEIKKIIMFLFTTTETELAPVDPRNPEAKWVSPDKVADLLTHPKDKEFFESVLIQLKAF